MPYERERIGSGKATNQRKCFNHQRYPICSPFMLVTLTKHTLGIFCMLWCVVGTHRQEGSQMEPQFTSITL
jgi:hypothetical protein